MEAEPMGVVLLLAAPSRRFTPELEASLKTLLEPLAMALFVDRQFHELARMREAAEADNRALLSRLGREDIVETIVGADRGLREVMIQVDQVAPTDAPVLVLGETGSGKEVIARAIHARSRRTSGPMLRVNCGAIPPEIVDSELFGHERGSFTGAVNMRRGWFERADGGTLFLDEIGELPLAAQVRLLRILQDGSFERVGGQRTLSVDVRIVAATHMDLPAMVAAGTFRRDLWYRLSVFVIRLPPLREHPEDIPALARYFAARAGRRLTGAPLEPTGEDIALLRAYPWPGNVRQLAATIERAAILGDCTRLDVRKAMLHDIPTPEPLQPTLDPAWSHAPGAMPTHEQAEDSSQLGLLTARRVHPQLETPPAVGHTHGANPFASLDTTMAQHIVEALTLTRGRIEGPHGAAALLGINPHTLRARMRKLRIDWRRYRVNAVPGA
jgi:transcriptional regulator with GAF, ATPase, and Fis domain